MASIVIPTRTDLPAYTEIVEIQGIEFLLDFKWNTRDQSWVLDIFTPDEEPILSGIKIVILINLLGLHSSPQLPNGTLTAVDDRDQTDIIKVDNLGDPIELLFTDFE